MTKIKVKITGNKREGLCSIVEHNGYHMLCMPDGTVVPCIMSTKVIDDCVDRETVAIVKLRVNLGSVEE